MAMLRTCTALVLEVMALRRQIAVLERNLTRRPSGAEVSLGFQVAVSAAPAQQLPLELIQPRLVFRTPISSTIPSASLSTGIASSVLPLFKSTANFAGRSGCVIHSKSPDLVRGTFRAPRLSRRPHGASGAHVPHVPRGFPKKAPGNHIHLRTDTLGIRTDDHTQARIDTAPLRSKLGMLAYQITVTRPPVLIGLYSSWLNLTFDL
jgi:hypothetical protein